MLSSIEFIRQSLELHLFFVRIMKEHSFFLQIGFMGKDSDFIRKADTLRMEFDQLLEEIISISNGVVGNDILQSEEVITPYTLKAEMASSYFTGVKIPTNLTKAESTLMGYDFKRSNSMLEERVFMINKKAMELVLRLVQFKSCVLSGVIQCKIFTNNYPLLIEHILREATLYYKLIERLQNNEEMNIEKEAYEQEVFWNRIMAEHSKFIRGLLDPTENELIDIANKFGNEFDNLTKETIKAIDMTIPLSETTENNLKATKKIKEFKQQGTQGLVECKIKSIIIPLLGDHTLREANHYLRLLEMFKTKN